MPDTSLVESLDYAGSGAKYDKTAKRVMWTGTLVHSFVSTNLSL